LPSSLESLSFGSCFDQSLERVTLPSSLESFSAPSGGDLSCNVFVSSAGCASRDAFPDIQAKEACVVGEFSYVESCTGMMVRKGNHPQMA
jgi:hypothetical protein